MSESFGGHYTRRTAIAAAVSLLASGMAAQAQEATDPAAQTVIVTGGGAAPVLPEAGDCGAAAVSPFAETSPPGGELPREHPAAPARERRPTAAGSAQHIPRCTT